MVKKANRVSSKRSSMKLERTFVYRGIKILPIPGRRSATALAFRDALLRTVSSPQPGKHRR
jgi:hypothetical protein